jgi:hypothetical protein
MCSNKGRVLRAAAAESSRCSVACMVLIWLGVLGCVSYSYCLMATYQSQQGTHNHVMMGNSPVALVLLQDDGLT